MIEKLKGRRPDGQFERFEGDYRAVEVREINELINQINQIYEVPKYKVYTASIQQTGTTVPIETLHNNTTGNTATWKRTGPGAYIIMFSNSYDITKVWGMSALKIFQYDSEFTAELIPLTNRTLTLTVYDNSGTLTDNFLADIEIRFYN